MSMKRTVFLVSMCLLFAASAIADSLEEQVIGEWVMELRILRLPGVVYYQEEASIFVNEKQPDGTFRVLARITTHAVADSENLLPRPECEGKTECTYDDASEGTGRLINGQLFVDWFSEGWIDDVFTISGNTMSGDDGNGPINLTKKP